MTLTGLSFFVIICVKRCLDCWISHPGVTSRADGEHSLALTVWFLCTQHASGKTKQKKCRMKVTLLHLLQCDDTIFFFINFKRRMLPDVCLTFNATVTPVSGGRRLWHDQRWLWFFFFAMNLQSRCLWNICFKDGEQVSLAVSCCLEVVIKWHEDRTSQLSF